MEGTMAEMRRILLFLFMLPIERRLEATSKIPTDVNNPGGKEKLLALEFTSTGEATSPIMRSRPLRRCTTANASVAMLALSFIREGVGQTFS